MAGNTKTRLHLFAAAVFCSGAACTSAAVAADVVAMLQKVHNGWYIAGRITNAFGDDTTYQTLGSQVQAAYQPALNISAAAGYTFDSQGPIALRTEAEVGQATFNVDTQTISGVGSFSGNQAFGNTKSTYGLVNAYADYEIGPVAPFVSAGVGLAQLDFNNHGAIATGPLLNDTSNGLAWQVGAGASYAVSDSLKLDLGYRYFGVNDVGITALDTTSSTVGLRSHEIRLGIRKSF